MPDLPGAASAFERFPCLPTELRLKIWQAHFDEASAIHVFSSGPLPGAYPHYTTLDARSNRIATAATEVARARLANSEANDAFQRSFSELRLSFPECLNSLDPRSYMWMYGSMLHRPGQIARPEGERMMEEVGLFRRTVLERDAHRAASRYLVNFRRDMLYVIDYEGGDLFSRMCGGQWMPQVQRIALAVVDFRVAGCVWNHNNLRRAILSQATTAEPFLDGTSGGFTEFFLVAIPPKRSVGEGFLRALERDEFGFLPFVAAGLILGSEHRRIATQTYERVAKEIRGAFPMAGRPYKVRFVVDVDFKDLDGLVGGAHVYSRYRR